MVRILDDGALIERLGSDGRRTGERLGRGVGEKKGGEEGEEKDLRRKMKRIRTC